MSDGTERSTAATSSELGGLTPDAFFQGSTHVVTGAISSLAVSDTPTLLLAVPGRIAVSVADTVASGLQLEISNPTSQTLAAVVGGSTVAEHDLTPGAATAMVFPVTNGVGQVHIKILPKALFPEVVTIIVSADNASIVGQAFSGPSRCAEVDTQLAHEFAAADGGRAVALSASKDIEPGARAMLLHADGLFRLDVMVRGDSLQTFVRNLTDGPLDIHGDVGGPGVGTITLGDAAAYAPRRADLGFTLGAHRDRVMTKVTVGTLRFSEHGTIRVSAQAVVRRAG